MSGESTGGDPTIFLICFFGIILGCGLPIVFSVIGDREDRGASAEFAARRAAYEAREAKTDYLAMLKEKDPDFSVALFEDFARALFSRAHGARHDPAALGRLAPYLSAKARKQLQSRPPVGTPVTAVVLGAMRYRKWNLNELTGQFVVEADFEANLMLDGSTQVLSETWSLGRSARARTRVWEGVRTFGCPSCGAPLERVAEELCESCGQQVPPGRFDWTVNSIEEHGTSTRARSLLDTVAEEGTDRSTVVDNGLASALAALQHDDPVALEGFDARLKLVFDELNAAWRRQDLQAARAYLSAGLFATLQKQLEPYRTQGLVNAVEGARIVRWEMVKVARDARHDALVLRLFGTGCDHTYVAATGRVVSGDKETERPYSEYWTFLRGRSARGAPRADKSCPQCGAPLAVGMEGNCQHCGAAVASGDFDWVLSGIDQDDAYRG